MSNNSVEGHVEYRYSSSAASHTSAYLQDRVLALIRAHTEPGSLILDAGCGNGWFARELARAGFVVAAIDASETGIDLARTSEEAIEFRSGSIYDDLRQAFGKPSFDAVVSLEVLEHLYDPRMFLARTYEALDDDGVLVLSTPYHGYAKNLVMAISGALDRHFTALWDGGHIKFWSKSTLTKILEEQGFEVVRFAGVGRLPYLWKSMVIVARKKSSREIGKAS
ncbi:MAG: methyltransferase domain-containing protein [Thermoanaerobaculia bacterium]